MKFFVFSDLHGFCKYTKQALQDTGYDKEKGEKKVVLCGDLLDRGSEAVRLVELMLELQDKGELIYIQGNHESLFWEALLQIISGKVGEVASFFSHHVANKTWDTFLQLAEMKKKEALRYPKVLVNRVKSSRFYKELLPTCIDYYETEHYVFCHGFIPMKRGGVLPTYDPNWRNASFEAWENARWENGMDCVMKYGIRVPQKTIVCGHWHSSYGHTRWEKKGSEFGKDADFSPFYSEGLIAIDGCVAVGHKVNCIVIEDDPLS